MQSIEYRFDIILFLPITFHELKITPSCIHIGLHKRESGLWPQLLKKRARLPAYIRFDTEHSVMSSSEDDESDNESPLLLFTSELRYYAFSLFIVSFGFIY